MISCARSPQSTGSGYFTVIFLAAQEVSRDTASIASTLKQLGSSMTSADGSYTMAVPDSGSDSIGVVATFGGDEKWWPAQATLNWAGRPVIAAGGVRSAASFVGGPIAPGEIVTIFGFDLGPAAPAALVLDDRKIAASPGATRVLFDGVGAPLLYSQSGQVNAVVPYVAGGKTSTIPPRTASCPTASTWASRV